MRAHGRVQRVELVRPRVHCKPSAQFTDERTIWRVKYGRLERVVAVRLALVGHIGEERVEVVLDELAQMIAARRQGVLDGAVLGRAVQAQNRAQLAAHERRLRVTYSSPVRIQ